MPHLVEMHRRHAKDGLALVTVSLDNAGDPRARANALRFLQSRRVDAANFFLADPSALAAGGFHFNVIPCLFVFDRAGQARHHG